MKLSPQAKKMIQVIIIFSIIVLVLAGLYYRSKEVIPFLIGLTLGSVVSIIRVLMLENTVNKILHEDKNPASAQFSHLARLLLAAIALIIGASVEGISLIGVILGIISFQIGTYSLNTRLTDKEKDNINKINKNKED